MCRYFVVVFMTRLICVGIREEYRICLVCSEGFYGWDVVFIQRFFGPSYPSTILINYGEVVICFDEWVLGLLFVFKELLVQGEMKY